MTVRRATVRPHRGDVVVTDPAVGPWRYPVHETWPGKGTISAPGRTVIDVLREGGMEHLDLIKVYLEGGEKDLFEGDAGFLGRVASVAIELADRPRPGWSRVFCAVDGAFTDERLNGATVLMRRNDAP